jgi:transcriptional regulator with XRE-family HTH domain
MATSSSTSSKDARLIRFGGVVRSRRKAKGLSQEALADLAGIDRAHMGKIERGERNVTLLNVLKIADAIECTAFDLFGEAGL